MIQFPETMRAIVLDSAAQFEVAPELLPDGSWAPPAKVTITYRPCWRKPPVELHLSLAYYSEGQGITYYMEDR